MLNVVVYLAELGVVGQLAELGVVVCHVVLGIVVDLVSSIRQLVPVCPVVTGGLVELAHCCPK